MDGDEWRGVYWAGRTGPTKALWSDRVWCIQEAEKVPVWLEHSGEWMEEARGVEW